MGLALGGSLDNAVVIDGGKILNPEGLRFENEFVLFFKSFRKCGNISSYDLLSMNSK